MSASINPSMDPDDSRRIEALSLERLAQDTYQEMRELASYASKDDRNIIRATSLVSEYALKCLDGAAEQKFETHAHWRAHLLERYRRIIIDRVRTLQALKRGGGGTRPQRAGDGADGPQATEPAHARFSFTLDPDAHDIPAEIREWDAEQLEATLERLRLVRERWWVVVSLRFHSSLTMKQIADHLGITDRAAMKDWELAKAWLRERLAPSNPE